MTSDDTKREKNWKDLYTRSVKLARSKQLGVDYPRHTDQELKRDPVGDAELQLNVLFICSRNRWRSPTAETVWRKHPALSVRSAGTSPNARHSVSEKDLRWCDVILVMEEKHESRLRAQFERLIGKTPIYVLDIPDEYKYMEPALVAELRSSVAQILGIEPLA